MPGEMAIAIIAFGMTENNFTIMHYHFPILPSAEFVSGRISSTRISTCDFGTSTSGTSRPTITLPTVNSK